MVGLFSGLEFVHMFWVFSGTRVSLMASRCCSISFCTAICAVSALTSQPALQSEACISAAK